MQPTVAALPSYRDAAYSGRLRASRFLSGQPAHEWLFVPVVDLSAFFTRKPDILRQAFSLVPEYLKTAEDGQAENYMNYGVQLGRRFRALKLWFVLRYFGVEGIAARLRQHIALAREFAGWVDADPQFERMAPAPFSTICFRAHPLAITEPGQLDQINARLLEAVNGTGQVFLSHTKLHDRVVLRMAIGNLRTERRHIEEAWRLLRQKLAEVMEG